MVYGTEQMFWILLSKSIIGYYKNCWAINGVLVCRRMFINFILGEFFYICFHFVRKRGKAEFGKWNLIIDSIKSIESFGCRTELQVSQLMGSDAWLLGLWKPKWQSFCSLAQPLDASPSLCIFKLGMILLCGCIIDCHFFPSLSLRFQPTFSIDWVICQPLCVIASKELHKLIHFWLLRFCRGSALCWTPLGPSVWLRCYSCLSRLIFTWKYITATDSIKHYMLKARLCVNLRVYTTYFIHQLRLLSTIASFWSSSRHVYTIVYILVRNIQYILSIYRTVDH